MTGVESRRVHQLPGGYLDFAGVLHREVRLTPLTGLEEELLGAAHGAPAAQLVTEVLCHCARWDRDVRPLSADVARRLLVADRQFLLLRLREITFGDRVEGRLACPWPDCAARVDIDFTTGDIPVKRCATIAPVYRVELSEEAALRDDDGSVHRTLSFRLPTGEDQEVVEPTLAANPARALTLLLERCIVGSDAPPGDPHDLCSRLSPLARREIERAIEAQAPAVDLEMDLRCPECGRGFTVPFDVTDFFFGEVRTSRDLLYRQVHYLAYHYHWSEAEILAMPREKRLTYIDILADEIEVINSAP